MGTIFMGGNLISYEDPRAPMSRQAREAAYYEQFQPENLREILIAPTLAMLAAALIGTLMLASFLNDGVSEPRLEASAGRAAVAQSFRQSSPAERVGQGNEIRSAVE